MRAPSFKQSLAQGGHLRAREAGAGRAASQLLHEHVGGGGQQHPQLIGQEARAAGAVDLKPVMQFFYAVLDVGAGAVDLLVQPPGSALEIGDDEARIHLRLAPRMARDLGLDDHAALALPAPGGIVSLPVDVSGLAAAAERRRAVPMRRAARRARRLFLAIATT